jgi:hypothetical protein
MVNFIVINRVRKTTYIHMYIYICTSSEKRVPNISFIDSVRLYVKEKKNVFSIMLYKY